MNIRAIRGSLLFLALTVAATASDLRLVRVWPEWRDAKSFKRISEYFTGRENTGGQLILRTQPAQRAGYYFLVRVDNPGTARRVRFQLQLIREGTPAPTSTDFPADLPAGASVFQLGLTGADWPDAKSQPVAWQLRVLSAEDHELAREKSYLWDKPAGN